MDIDRMSVPYVMVENRRHRFTSSIGSRSFCARDRSPLFSRTVAAEMRQQNNGGDER